MNMLSLNELRYKRLELIEEIKDARRQSISVTTDPDEKGKKEISLLEFLLDEYVDRLASINEEIAAAESLEARDKKRRETNLRRRPPAPKRVSAAEKKRLAKEEKEEAEKKRKEEEEEDRRRKERLDDDNNCPFDPFGIW